MNVDVSSSVNIPSEKLIEMQNHATALQALLAEYLIALSPQERHDLPKMGDATVPFVEKSLEYVKSNPELVPNFVPIRIYQENYAAVGDLKSLYIPLAQMLSNLSDTIMLSGSKSYACALKHYEFVQAAARANVPNAKPIKEDLAKRFVKASKKMDPIV